MTDPQSLLTDQAARNAARPMARVGNGERIMYRNGGLGSKRNSGPGVCDCENAGRCEHDIIAAVSPDGQRVIRTAEGVVPATPPAVGPDDVVSVRRADLQAWAHALSNHTAYLDHYTEVPHGDVDDIIAAMRRIAEGGE